MTEYVLMTTMNIFDEQHMLSFIMLLGEGAHKESDFLEIVDNHYIVQKKLNVLISVGLVEQVVRRERGRWYALTPKGTLVVSGIIRLEEEIDAFEG